MMKPHSIFKWQLPHCYLQIQYNTDTIQNKTEQKQKSLNYQRTHSKIHRKTW